MVDGPLAAEGLALLLAEPEAERIARAIASDPRRLVSAFSSLETAIVIEAKKGELAGREAMTYAGWISPR